MIKRLFLKFLILVVTLGVNSVSSTNANLFDAEESSANSFSAGSVDFSLDGSGFNLPALNTDDPKSKNVKVVNDGSLDFEYSVEVVQTGGDTALCNALRINARLDGTSQYNGNLTGLNLNPATTISGSDDAWRFTVRLNNTNPNFQAKSCSFDLVFKGWQVGSDGTWGLTDTEVLSNTVTTADTIKPESIITNPFNLGSDNIVLTVNWNGDIQGTASDSGSGVNRVELSIYRVLVNRYWNGSSWVNGSESSVRVPAVGTTNWSYNLPPPHLGIFIITSHAIDNAGNLENSYTITINNTELGGSALDFYLREDKKAVGFKVEGYDLDMYTSLDYLITYNSDQGTQGIVGTKTVSGVSKIVEENLILGSCSSGGVCTYNTGVSEINIEVTLHGSTEKVLEQTISI